MHISIMSELMAESMTTQAPPRSSEPGGRYTNAGCLYVRSWSTIRDPACSRQRG